MTIRIAGAVALLVSTLYGQSGPARDGEIRTVRDTFTGDTTTTLTLLLRGPKGPLPVNMLVTRTRTARAATGRPTLQIDFDMRTFVGQLDYRPPHVKLTLDAGTKDERSQELTANPKIPLRSVNLVTIPITSGTLSSLARATTIHGAVVGIAFELTSSQMSALRDFSRTN